MEQEIDAGKIFSNMTKKTSRDADTEGITEFMYGAAVATLASCWEYGEGLRR